jgi:serine protease AprX
MRRVILLALLTTLLAAGPAPAAETIVRFDPDRIAPAQLRDRLAGLGLRSATLRRLPFAAVQGDASALAGVRALPGVVSTHPNTRLEFHLHESVPLLFGGAEQLAAHRAAGRDGSGQTVAVVDSGTDGLHPDLRDRVVRNVKVTGTDGIATDGAFTHYVECPTACTTDTSSGHGTHVSGTAVGDGTASGGHHTGVAPGARLVGISTGEAIAVFHALQAFDYLLDHPELDVVAVNGSFGPSGGGRFDATEPVNVATKALHDAGVAVVFSSGNSSFGDQDDPEGSSDCSPDGDGTCVINPYSVAPWTIGAANLRKDSPGTIGDQPLNLSSSRGDPDPQRSLDGSLTIDYRPTVAAPGTNIWAARSLNGATAYSCGASAEPPSCTPARPEYLAHYASMSGTSMAAPHVTGAIAVIQQAAVATQGTRLTPDEVKALLEQTAAPLTKVDGYWDWPCPDVIACGSDVDGTTGAPYASWQAGAGALDVDAALSALAARGAARRAGSSPPRGPRRLAAPLAPR